jgi:hypothetical protein
MRSHKDFRQNVFVLRFASSREDAKRKAKAVLFCHPAKSALDLQDTAGYVRSMKKPTTGAREDAHGRHDVQQTPALGRLVQRQR